MVEDRFKLTKLTTYRLVSRYPIPSLILLFRNLVQHPTHPRAAEDLALLETAPAALKQCASYRLRKEEVDIFQMIDSFFNEIVRLAKCAQDRSVDAQQ
jgi:hypothetical protein